MSPFPTAEGGRDAALRQVVTPASNPKGGFGGSPGRRGASHGRRDRIPKRDKWEGEKKQSGHRPSGGTGKGLRAEGQSEQVLHQEVGCRS